MKKTLITAALLCIIASAMFLVQGSCSAAETPMAVPQINLEMTLSDNLLAMQGKTISVILSTGQTISGVVKNVKNGNLHLEKLVQKEFFDAIVVIDKISAVEIRVKYQ